MLISIRLAAASSGFKIPVSTLAEVGRLVEVADKPFAVSVPGSSSLDESKMSSATTPDLTRKVNTVDRRVAAPLE